MERSRTFLVLLITAGVLTVLGVGIALAALPPGGTFTDDDGNVHEANIEAIAAKGITKGCNPPTNDLYCPSRDLTRGQMAAFIRRARNLPASTTDYFIDDNNSVFEGDINALAEAGITKGCNPSEGNTKFCPEGKVRREVMAAFLRRAFSYPASSTDFFADDNDSIFEADINAIAEAGVTKGCNPSEGNTNYCPTSLVKRDQMASFFARALGLPPVIPDPPTTTTSTVATTTTQPPATSIAVATGTNGAIVTSVDGETWTTRTSTTGASLLSASWDGTQWVSVGTGGAIVTSGDGIAWTSRTSGTTLNLFAVAGNGTQWVAVGDQGVILSTPDTVTWTTRTTTDVDLYGIAWDGAQWVAVGFDGRITTSPDGITWTPRTSGTTKPLNDVAWDGTQLVAVGVQGTVLTSPDAATWTSQTSGITVTGLESVAPDGTQWVAVGSLGKIVTSPDAVTWTARASGTTETLNAVSGNGTQWVAVGGLGTILTSDDAITWTQQVSGTTQYLYGVDTSSG